MNSIIWRKWAVSKFLVNRSFLSYIQGEYIAPEKIENIYTQCSMVHQVFVHGDSKKVGSAISCVDDIVVFEMKCCEPRQLELLKEAFWVTCAVYCFNIFS